MLLRARKKLKEGFTITELLLVMALIAILAAIILPIITRAKGMSYQAKCASNLRQFGMAFSMYSHDWDEYLPGPGGLSGDRTYWSQSGSGGLQGYVKQRGVGSIWTCPLLTEWDGQFPARSYSMNSYLRTVIGYNYAKDIEYPTCVEYPTCLSCQQGIRTDRIQMPGKTILLFEGIPLTGGFEDKLDYLYRCANWSRVRGYIDKIVNTIQPGKPWHGRNNNYLYCDGHVIARPPGRKTTGVLSTQSEMFEWYVDKARYQARCNTIWVGVPFK
ncbi:prepilin-type N-terminal cleavage/methylation domain-containing protein [bacterium]|nr:prepilin-type N-terminal cleavage/methylation domain-containing protein [bacterium]